MSELSGRPVRVALWDAINAYVVSCGGDPSRHVYGNTTRMRAVSDVESAVDEEVSASRNERALREVKP